jgi:hypothetical protein
MKFFKGTLYIPNPTLEQLNQTIEDLRAAGLHTSELLGISYINRPTITFRGTEAAVKGHPNFSSFGDIEQLPESCQDIPEDLTEFGNQVRKMIIDVATPYAYSFWKFRGEAGGEGRIGLYFENANKAEDKAMGLFKSKGYVGQSLNRWLNLKHSDWRNGYKCVSVAAEIQAPRRHHWSMDRVRLSLRFDHPFTGKRSSTQIEI